MVGCLRGHLKVWLSSEGKGELLKGLRRGSDAIRWLFITPTPAAVQMLRVWEGELAAVLAPGHFLLGTPFPLASRKLFLPCSLSASLAKPLHLHLQFLFLLQPLTCCCFQDFFLTLFSSFRLMSRSHLYPNFQLPPLCSWFQNLFLQLSPFSQVQTAY